MKNPFGAHLGDLPNLVVDQQGVGRARVVVQGMVLKSGTGSIGLW